MEFPDGNSESWRTNEVLERKKAIANKLAELLDVEGHIERVLDSGDRLVLSAEGINSEGEKVSIHFDLTSNLHDDVYSFMIYGIPTHEEAEKLLDYVPEEMERQEIIDKMLISKKPQKLYRLDKRIYDTETGDPDATKASAMAALFGNNDSDRPDDAEEFLASRYEIDEEGRRVSYGDNYAETRVNSERAEKLIEGLTVGEVKMHLGGVLQTSQEHIKSSRERLLSLEKEGKFVFHGSPVKTDTLEPRQPYNHDDTTGKMKKHGGPSISASPFAEIAIFRAIVHPNDFDEFQGGMGVDETGQLVFDASKKVLEKIKGKKGYVYVFLKSQFELFSPMEMRSQTKMKPEEIVEVSYDDLPSNIRAIETNQEK